MLYDFIEIDDTLSTPVYRQLHDQLRQAILDGLLAPEQKMMSIRAAAAELSLSRMTVETAYQQLCMEGYLQSRPQSGYFVTAYAFRPRLKQTPLPPQTTPITFDFGSRRVDAAHADLHLWQKYMRAVLSQEEVITSYGEAQGERTLREALAAYAFKARGVHADPSQIVIGAGTQPLLTLLCGLLSEQKPLTVGLEAPGFPQAEQVFDNFGIPICHLDKYGTDIPERIDLYIYMAARTKIYPFQQEIERRKQLAAWRAATPGRFILEDDYNGELRFLTRPLPSLQGFDENVIFLGSFSKLLLPSIRIGYMVLPETLAEKFRAKSSYYNQTAGKVEQLALAEYIRQGQLEKHLRRLRRLYQKKTYMVEQALSQYMGNAVEYELWETELRYLLTVHSRLSAKELADSAQMQGVNLAPLGAAPDGRTRLVLSFAGIPLEHIEPGIQTLSKCWELSGK